MSGAEKTVIRWTHGLPAGIFGVFALAGALFWLTPLAPISPLGSIVLVILIGYAGLSAIIPETAILIQEDLLLTRTFEPMPLNQVGAFEIRLTQVLIYSREGLPERFVVATPLSLKSAPVAAIRRLAEVIGVEVVVNLTGWPSRRLKATKSK